jgi:hypothetical protein
MIVLSTTSSKIQVFLGDAITLSQLACYASYRDTTTTSITPLRNVISTNNTTAVDLVDSPAASTQRVVDYLSIQNIDTSTNKVIVTFYDGSTSYRLMETRLSPGEKLEYQEGHGFKVIGNGSSIKTFTSFDGVGSSSGFAMSVLKRDFLCTQAASSTSLGTSSNSAKSLPDLKLPIFFGKIYWFRYVLFYDVDATTTGVRFNPVIEGGPIQAFTYRVSLTSASESIANGLSGASITTPTATSAATSGNVAIIEGHILFPWRDGYCTIQAAAEFTAPQTSSSVTIRANSFLQYQQLT